MSTAQDREPDLRGASIWFAGTYFAIRDSEIEANPVSDSPRETFTPAEFRSRLALLGRLVADADPGPDLTEVEELARAIHSHRCTGACDEGPDSLDRTSAEAALQWMREREAQP